MVWLIFPGKLSLCAAPCRQMNISLYTQTHEFIKILNPVYIHMWGMFMWNSLLSMYKSTRISSVIATFNTFFLGIAEIAWCLYQSPSPGSTPFPMSKERNIELQFRNNIVVLRYGVISLTEMYSQNQIRLIV